MMFLAFTGYGDEERGTGRRGGAVRGVQLRGNCSTLRTHNLVAGNSIARMPAGSFNQR